MSTSAICASFSLLITCKLVSGVNFEVFSAGMISEGYGASDLYVPGNPEEVERLYVPNYGIWITYSQFINTANSTFNEMKLLYNNMTELNENLMLNNSEQMAIGNLITCAPDECGINDDDRIAAKNYVGICLGCTYPNILIPYFPIYMNSIWNLNEITNIANNTNEDVIIITAFFYTVYGDDEDKNTVDAIKNKLFPNSSSS